MTVVKIDDHLLVQSMIDYGSYGQQKMDGHENIERARSIFEKLPLGVVSPEPLPKKQVRRYWKSLMISIESLN